MRYYFAYKNKNQSRNHIKRPFVFACFSIVILALLVNIVTPIVASAATSKEATTAAECKARGGTWDADQSGAYCSGDKGLAYEHRDDPPWLAESYWRYRALEQCVIKERVTLRDTGVDNGMAASGNIFYNKGDHLPSQPRTYGFYARDKLQDIGDDGLMDCAKVDSELMVGSLNFWGLDGIELVCGAGLYVRLGNADCINGTSYAFRLSNGDTTTKDREALLNYLLWSVYGDGASANRANLDHRASYIFTRDTFLKGCAYGVQPVTVNPGGDRTYEIAIVEGEGSSATTKNVYYTVKHNNKKTPIYIYADGRQKTCEELAFELRADGGYAKAYLAYVKAGGTNNSSAPGQNGGTEEQSTCSIDGIGFIVCPVMTFLAEITDRAYSAVELLLTVPPLEDNSSGTNVLYQAWSMMRNIANVAFVIAFLVIIYSQITGVGITNYGIKKMLPRIIIAAILVNVSYWICVIAVDISNILGSSLKGLIDSYTNTLHPDKQSSWFQSGVAGSTGWSVAWTTGTALVIAGGIAAYSGSLAILVPVLLAAVLAVFTVLVVLVARQALIIALIVVAPLAFVAFLLPNTEKWFERWRDFFISLLALFPIVAIVFGASKLASVIIMNSSPNNMLVQIMGAGVAIIPLAITPLILKFSTGILGKIGAFVNNPNRGPIDSIRKQAEQYGKDRKANVRSKFLNVEGGRNRLSRGYRRVFGATTRMGSRSRAKGDAMNARAEAAESGFLLDNKNSIEASQVRMAKSAADSARQSRALQGLDSEAQRAAVGVYDDSNRQLNAAIRGQIQSGEQQAVKEATAEISPQSANQLAGTLSKAIQEGDSITAQAAQNRLDTMGNKGVETFADVIRKRESAGDNKNWDSMRTELARNMSGGMMGKSEVLKNWAASTSLNDKGKLDDSTTLDSYKAKLMQQNGAASMTVQKFAGQTPNIQQELIKSGALPMATMKNAISDQNIGSIDPAAAALIKQAIQAQQDQDKAYETYAHNIAKSEQDAAYATYSDNIKVSQADGLKINHDAPTPRPPETMTPEQRANYDDRMRK